MYLEAGSGKSIKAIGTAPSAAYQCVSTSKDISRASGLVSYATLETTFDDDPVVEIVTTPAEATDREVEYICIANVSSGSETITVRLYGGTTDPMDLVAFTLATTERIVYTNKTGWQCYLASGALKTTV